MISFIHIVLGIYIAFLAFSAILGAIAFLCYAVIGFFVGMGRFGGMVREAKEKRRQDAVIKKLDDRGQLRRWRDPNQPW